MEKRIELEKRGRAAEEVSGVHSSGVEGMAQRGLETLTKSQLRN